MDNEFKAIFWNQFGASIDMLESALRSCPPDLWTAPMWGSQSDRPDLAQFWYVAYHNLFWLDLYLSGTAEGFYPPEPFGLEELDPAGVIPATVYPPETLLTYLSYCREKCRSAVSGLTEESARRRCDFPWGQPLYIDLLLDNMRHVQEHAAQLNMFLGQQAGREARWSASSKT